MVLASPERTPPVSSGADVLPPSQKPYVIPKQQSSWRQKLVCLLALVPIGARIEDTVDLIEVNHFYNGEGSLIFDQIIFYDWSNTDSRFQVRAWRLKKADDQIPRKNPQRNGYEAVWHDGDTLRRVQAKQTRETWTQYDPEVVEQQNRPKERRAELQKIRP